MKASEDRGESPPPDPGTIKEATGGSPAGSGAEPRPSFDLYQDIILTHNRAPKHMRRLDPFDASAKGDNPMCGDRCEVRITHGPGDTLAEIAFEARGCAISIASADLMAETTQGRTQQNIRDLAETFANLVRTGDSDSADPAIATLRPLSGVADYPSRIKCATLPWAALIAALDGGKGATSE